MARKSNIDSTPISGVYPDKKTGEAPYRVVFRYLDRMGKTKQSSRRNFSTVQEANEFRRQKERELEQAQTPIDDQITLGEYLDYWKDLYVLPHLKQSTIDGYINCIRIIRENLGHVRLCKLDHSTINAFYLNLRQPATRDASSKPMALNSIRYVKRVLNKALGDAILEKIIRENPCRGIKVSGKSETTYNTLTKSEVEFLKNHIKGTALFLPVSLCVTMGLRRGEALGLCWEDVDFENETISIRKSLVMTSAGPILQTPKTKNSFRTLPMQNKIKPILLAAKADRDANRKLLGKDYNDNDFVCSKENGDTYSPNYITHRFANVLNELPITKIRYHDLRHTFATLALENNVPLKLVSHFLGHATLSITGNTYSHVTDPLARKHFNAIADFIWD
ncbi:tyrosine-type recombinase/integrase [Anaeroarcus burkinensis]|uniref:tyrosine-type recombinase/integrase n=1 Tax=Anaeroarcus burkinensis TaxID=82376 RepID=UPI0004011356|nr:site-specific integrase [Anaeroarcus burkinensis]